MCFLRKGIQSLQTFSRCPCRNQNMRMKAVFFAQLLVYFVPVRIFFSQKAYCIMKAKIVIIILLAVLLIIFVLQNTEVVVVKLWFWDASIPRALLLFVTFAIGLIIGFMVPSTRKTKDPDPE